VKQSRGLGEPTPVLRELLRELRTLAALEDKSAPDLMKATIAAYLQK
jgi:hypothetical protein